MVTLLSLYITFSYWSKLLKYSTDHENCICNFKVDKGHSFCKQCLHNLQFKKPRYSSPKTSKLARADISCQFKKAMYLYRHSLQNEWTLVFQSYFFFIQEFLNIFFPLKNINSRDRFFFVFFYILPFIR